jgi:ubiquinone/menaquinone biosynthesis C-methylase UbiE
MNPFVLTAVVILLAIGLPSAHGMLGFFGEIEGTAAVEGTGDTSSGATIAQGIPVAVIEASIREGTRDAPFLAEALGLIRGMRVADIGAGFGGWTLPLARLVGDTGSVYATEIGNSQLAVLRDLVGREGLSNVIILEGAADTTNLPDNCCDAVFMRNVYHHLPKPEPMIASAYAALKPGGRLAIVEFPAPRGSALPPGVRENRGGNGIPLAVVIDEMKASAFSHVTTIAAWPPLARHPSYFLVVFEKPAQ